MLKDLNFHLSPSVIVGPGDDAGVFQPDKKTFPNGEWAFVETVDIITPLVDDPFLFGAISATNSLSDVYAMGGKPLTALAILGYDPCDFDRNIIKEILRGCISQLERAGVSLLGGHTVEDPEVKFGLSVTGVVLKKDILRKDGAMPGDLLCLTKPLGTGLATTAHKAQRLPEEWFKEALSWMLMLNDRARDIALKAKARACTDVTGFGLLGHSLNMISQRPVDYHLFFDRIPKFTFVKDLIQSGFVPKGSYDNLNFCRDKIISDLDEEDLLVLSDPQTSGGLLFSVSPENLSLIEGTDVFFSVIGEVREGPGRIVISRG